MNLSSAFSMSRALLDDPKGQFATDDYLTPFAQLAMGELSKGALENPNLGQLYGVVVLPAVPVGTPDLRWYFASGKDLELLTDVVSMKERSAGGTRSEQDWMWMDRAMDTPSFLQGAFNSYFAWRGDNIMLPGCNQAMDLRIFGKFAPKPFKNGDSPIVPGVGEILAYRTAGLAAGSRGNDSMFNKWDGKATILQDEFFNNAIMEMQNQRVRNRPWSSRGVVR